MGRPGTWQKGQSGNPKGYPKELAEVSKLARTHTKQAIKRLRHWLDSNNPKASVAAAIALLERAWGKPTQPVEMSSPGGGLAVQIVFKKPEGEKP